jgi:hypothetical protein
MAAPLCSVGLLRHSSQDLRPLAQYSAAKLRVERGPTKAGYSCLTVRHPRVSLAHERKERGRPFPGDGRFHLR